MRHRWLGELEYEAALGLQLELVGQRARGEIGDTALYLEHPHVFTRGRKSRDLSDLLDAGEVPVITTGRGGEVTYHGPGQLVVYLIHQLDRRPGEVPDAPAFIRRIEAWVIAALARVGLEGAGRRRGFSGVWVADKKIASVGVAVSAEGVTFHGVAVNVSTDMSYFERIRPCGLSAKMMTSLSEERQRPAEVRSLVDALQATGF